MRVSTEMLGFWGSGRLVWVQFREAFQTTAEALPKISFGEWVGLSQILMENCGCLSRSPSDIRRSVWGWTLAKHLTVKLCVLTEILGFWGSGQLVWVHFIVSGFYCPLSPYFELFPTSGPGLKFPRFLVWKASRRELLSVWDCIEFIVRNVFLTSHSLYSLMTIKSNIWDI